MRKIALASLALVAFAVVQAAEPLKSGPQKGDDLPGPFHPLNINGENAGQKTCLYCKYGGSPVAMVFARSATPEVTALTKKLDACCVKYKDAEMGCCVIFCSDDAALRTKLEEVAKKESFKEAVLAVDNPAGPKDYNIVKDAEVTVLLYIERTVKVNHTFRKGELNDKAIEKIIADVSKIIPKK